MYKKLLEQAQKKAAAARAILEGEDPNVEEATKLLAEAEKLRDQAKAIKAATDVESEATDGINAFDKAAAEPPTRSGIVVVENEADKAIKARPYSGLGEFLMDVKNAALGLGVDQRLHPLRSSDAMDEGGFSLTKALGAGFVGGG